MKFGIFPIEGGESWDDIVEQCEMVEEVGFESCWVNDHQATEGDNYWPSPLTRLTSIATGTEALELVTSVLIPPLYHPLHVAQRSAMLDVISDGRLTLGVGLGYVEKEFDAFGVPMDERAGRMIEGLRFLDRFLAAEEPISFECPFFSVEDWQPLPETVQDPRPPLWVGGWGDKQIARSVRFGDTWVPGVVADLEAVQVRKEKQRKHVEESGQNWDEIEHPLMREAVIGETEAEVLERKEYLPSHLRRRVRGRVLPPTDDRRHCRGLPRPRRGPIRLRNSWPDRRTDRRHARALRTRSPGASLPPLGDAQRAGRRPDPAVRRGGPAPRRVSDYGGRDIVVEAARRPLATVAWCVAGAGTRCH